MACKEWREDWVAHLYGELTDDEKRVIEDHLSGCASCRSTMRELAASRKALADSALPVPEAPRVVLLRPRRGWGPAWSFATGLVAASLVFFFGSVLTRPETQGLDDRIARLEAAAAQPATPQPEAVLTRAEFNEELQRFARQQRRERAKDLDYLARYLAASEQRTGTFMDNTQEALAYLALRGDPGVRER